MDAMVSGSQDGPGRIRAMGFLDFQVAVPAGHPAIGTDGVVGRAIERFAAAAGTGENEDGGHR
jgi:hypothetical protein